MADITIENKITKVVQPLRKMIELNAGGKMADDAELIALAQKTVPAGYKAKVMIMITINVEEV